jgi:hypothetical protein
MKRNGINTLFDSFLKQKKNISEFTITHNIQPKKKFCFPIHTLIKLVL